MLRRFNKLVEDDAAVKSIFDHIRNIVLSALVLAAGAWRYKHAGDGAPEILDYIVAALLGLVGVVLFAINIEHLHRKVRTTLAARWLYVLFSLLHAMVVLEVLRYLLQSTGP